MPLDEDDEHATYDPDAGRAPTSRPRPGGAGAGRVPRAVRGRSTPVNAWWGSFDLAVNLFSGDPADPPAGDFIMRNAMDAQEVAVGWWPGDERYGRAAFYAYAHPAPAASRRRRSSRGGAWDAALGEYVLDWDDVVAGATRTPRRWRSPAPPSARLRCVRMGSGAARQRRGDAAPDRLTVYGRVRNWPRNERAAGGVAPGSCTL